VRWTESFSAKLATEQVVHSFGRAEQMNIYISNAERAFVRSISTGIGGLNYHAQPGGTRGGSVDTVPGDSGAKEHVDFQGRMIVAYREYVSGARRVAIDVNGTSCTASVVLGRQAGRSALTQNSVRGSLDASSIQIGTVSCSIQDGNIFGQ
jgi:hypothetical protein